MAGTEPGEKWTGPFLNQMRLTADPLGDDTVTALFKNHGIQAVNDLWEKLLKNDGVPVEQLPPEIRTYLEKSGTLPAWAQPGLIEKAQKLFADRGFFCLLTLLTASLPECYVLKNESAVLGTTKDLEQHAYRRVLETAQLIVAVMSPGGFTPRGGGIVAAQKVRLLHATIRHLILHTPRRPESAAPPRTFPEAAQKMPPWDTAACGLPINQEDMAYTLLTFSYVTVRAFQNMKVRIAPDEIAAYLHCWNVMGCIMGVREDLLAQTCGEAEILFTTVKQNQLGQSASGEALTTALINCTRLIIARDSGGLLMHSLVKPLPQIFMHQLLDKQTLTDLKVPALTLGEWIIMQVLHFLVAPFENLYQKLMARAGLLIIDHLTQLPRRWNRSLFNLPEQIKTTWQTKAGRH
jgi:hypothetical protein